MAQRKADAKDKFWLYAFRDHLANLQAYSNCIHTADVFGDGDYKLLIADGSKKLKVYAGTALSQEIRLLGVPSAIASFYMSAGDAFNRPTVAVAVGPFVFTYRNAKPLYRFTTPTVQLDAEEVETWAKLITAGITLDEAIAIFEKKLDQGVDVSTRTLELLLMDSPAEREAFVFRFMDRGLVQNDVIVCMASVNLSSLEEGQPSCLVYGTEKRLLYVMNESITGVRVRVELPSTPVTMVTAGALESSYRIVVSCRDGRIYSVKDGALHSAVIQPDAQPCGISRYDNLVAVVTMANTLSYYNLKGKRQDVVFLPVSATNISTIIDTVTGNARGVIVGLSNGEVRVYVGKHLQHVSQAYGTITAMSYCRYGREDSALVLVLQNGSLVVELLHRNANLSITHDSKAAAPPEQDVPIPVPKLSSVFTLQTQREKEFGLDMYRSFQYDLCHLKLLTSKSYLSMIAGGETPAAAPSLASAAASAGATAKQADTAAVAMASSDPMTAASGSAGPPASGAVIPMQHRAASILGETSNVRFVATVQGLGPVYKIKGVIQNMGDVALHSLTVVFLYDAAVYTMPKSLFNVPFLVPGLSYPCDALIELKEGEAKGDGVLALVLGREESGRPLASTLVDLPEADLLEAA